MDEKRKLTLKFHTNHKLYPIFILFTLILLFFITYNGNSIRLENKFTKYNNSTQNIPNASQYSEDSIVCYFIYASQCSSCQAALEVVENFQNNNPNINFVYIDISASEENYTYAKEFFNTSSSVPYPSVVFVNGTCRYYIPNDYINLETLSSVYNNLLTNPDSCDGWITHEEFNIFYAFFVGLLSGLSPCIILIAGVFGANIFSSQTNKFFVFNLIGFLIGVFLAYIIIGIIFYFTLDVALIFFSGYIIQWIFGVPLILLGLWYIIDSFNEDSKLFNTPDKLKTLFKNFAGKGTLVSALLLGFSFTLLKSPCVAGILLSLLFSIKTSLFGLPTTILAFSFFALGIATPIVIIFLLLKLGVNNNKINEKRKNIRPILRLISGIMIIITTLLSFF